jgi:hypothetical protein
MVIYEIRQNAHADEDARFVIPLRGLSNSALVEAAGSVVARQKAEQMISAEP